MAFISRTRIHHSYHVSRKRCQPEHSDAYVKEDLKGNFSCSEQPSVERDQSNEVLSRGNHPLQSLNLNLGSLAKSESGDAAGRAQELLQRIEALYEEGYYGAAPDTVSYNSVLNAWARSVDKNGAERAMELFLTEMVGTTKENVNPNMITFNTIIWAFARRGMVEEASSFFDSMQSDYNMLPDTVSFNALMYAKAMARQAEECTALFRRMVRMSLTNESCKPDTISFNTLLHAWARSVDPRAPHRAEELLKHMERLHGAGNEDVIPDVYSYTTVIQAWSNSRDKQAHVRAQSLLGQMEVLCTDRQSLKPNVVTYTCVLNAMSRCGDLSTAQEATELLNKVLRRFEGGDASCKPDSATFTAVISCWASVDDQESQVDAGRVVMELLQRMKAFNRDGVLSTSPTARTYTCVLKSLRNSPKEASYEVARGLLTDMEAEYQSGNVEVEPSNIHYNVILDLVAKGSLPHKVQEAKLLYKEMLALCRERAKPNIITYNSLLRACANAYGSDNEKNEALTFATSIFKEVLNHDEVQPSSITFLFFLKTLRRQTSADDPVRLTMFRESIACCCRVGLLNDYILKQLELGLNSTQVEQVLGLERAPKELRARFLPQAWSKCS